LLRCQRSTRLATPHVQGDAHDPTVIVKHGHVICANLDREHMSLAELRAALRKEGIATIREVRYAILGEDEHVSGTPRRSVPA